MTERKKHEKDESNGIRRGRVDREKGVEKERQADKRRGEREGREICKRTQGVFRVVGERLTVWAIPYLTPRAGKRSASFRFEKKFEKRLTFFRGCVMLIKDAKNTSSFAKIFLFVERKVLP